MGGLLAYLLVVVCKTEVSSRRWAAHNASDFMRGKRHDIVVGGAVVVVVVVNE